MANYEENLYCDFDESTQKAIAGKDIILAVFDSTGTKLLAVSGQQGLTINRNAESIDVGSKDTANGWSSKIAGMKNWSIDNNGLYVPSSETHKVLGEAFNKSNPVCIKVVNNKTEKAMFGGLAIISDYSLDAPYDDAMTYDISLEGNGELVDLSEEEGASQMPGDEPVE